MFKKLREKVGVESPEKDGSSSPALRRSNTQLSGQLRSSQRGMRKTESSGSLSGAEEYSSSMSKEDLLSALLQRTTQVKRLEIKLADYGQSIKDIKRERDKLTIVLEKQQDAALKRMAELEETYMHGKAKMESTISTLEKHESELTETLDKLETENAKLRESVDEWDRKKEDFTKERDQFFAKRDNNEELQDLQMQEMAKLKHMLMRSEKECEKYRDEIDQKVAELIQCQDKCDELELSLRKTTESLNSTREQLEIQIKKSEKKGIKVKSLDSILSELKSQNFVLESKVESLSTELTKCQSSLSALEFSHTEVSEKYESLKHSSEAVMKKATVDLDEKDGTIEHLKKKIFSLEQRITTDSLPENEQVQALTLERNLLENRLEESHLQLSNIKSTWSTKINQLEQQVSNLNAKIAEDSRESSAKDDKISELEATYLKMVDDLRNKLRNTEAEVKRSAQQNESYVQQVTKLEADEIEMSAQFDLERAKLNSTIDKVNSKAKAIEEKLREDLKHLEESCDVCQNQIEELKKELAEHQKAKKEGDKALEVIQQSHNVMKEKCENLEELCGRLRHELKESEENRTTSSKDRANLKSQLETLNERLSALQSNYLTVSNNLGTANSTQESLHQELLEKNEELSKMQELLQSQKHTAEDFSRKVEEMKTSLQSREEELMGCKEEIATLRNSQAEDDNIVTILKAEKDKFEEKVAERERTIKVQQQRLNDLKKALNKELNKRSTGSASTSARAASPARHLQTNGFDGQPSMNGSQESVPDMSAIGTMAIDDPNLSAEQREINAKYLKHVILTFLGSGQSEAQQVIKAMSMLLNFNKDEERFVKQTLEYRTSWFGSKPSTKKVASSVVKQRKR